MGALKYILSIALFLGTGLSSFQEEVTIAWSPEVRLSWDDFRGKPQNSRAAAVTASGITYHFSSMATGDEVELDFTVSTFFYPDKSWYHPEVCDSVILSHEQLHFDISELFARKMRRRLKDTRFTKNVKAEVRVIYQETIRSLHDFQNRYDDETNFSRDREQQFAWNTKIAEALEMEQFDPDNP